MPLLAELDRSNVVDVDLGGAEFKANAHRQMHSHLPEKTADFLEAECLKMARRRLHCEHLDAVKIGPTRPIGGGPNWELLAFKPELHDRTYDNAMRAIHLLRRQYALARK